MSTNWDPEAEPFRCLWVCQSSASGCYGWRSHVRTFATEQEALDAMNRPFQAGVLRAHVDRWQGRGRPWKRVAGRKSRARRR